MRLTLKALSGLGAVAVVLGADRWFKLFQTYFDNIHINLSDYILITLIAIMCAIGIYDYRKQNVEKKTDNELDGKFNHTQNDILPAYSRLAGLETEQKDNNLIFMVNPINRRSTKRGGKTFEDAYQEVWEMENTPKTPLEVLTYGQSAFEHLKNKEYKDIYKHFEKAKELVEKFNQTKDESLKSQIDESVINFRRGIIKLTDKLSNKYTLKGKCSDCP